MRRIFISSAQILHHSCLSYPVSLVSDCKSNKFNWLQFLSIKIVPAEFATNFKVLTFPIPATYYLFFIVPHRVRDRIPDLADSRCIRWVGAEELGRFSST